MSTDHLLKEFAARIVSLSRAMGLDDDDERLLWEYIASLPADCRETRAADAIALLKDQAELSPVVVTGWEVSATIDPMFIKPAKGLLGRFRGRSPSFSERSSTRQVCYDIEDLKQRITSQVQLECFVLWFDRLQSVLREDAVNWNPPVSTDIKVEIALDVEDLLPGEPQSTT